MKIINPSDQNYIKSTIETIGREEADLLTSLGIGEAIISGQCVNFPILCKISLPNTSGVYEESDAFKYLSEEKNSSIPIKKSDLKEKKVNDKQIKQKIEIKDQNKRFTELFKLDDFISNENIKKKALEISDDAISIDECSLKMISATIQGIKTYKINIFINEKSISHDCPDYLNKRKFKKEFCKHLVKIFQFLEKKEGKDFTQYILNLIGNEKVHWKFD